MRTFSRESWDAAQSAWRDGGFGSEWRDVRHQAALRGMLYPPDGTRWDVWDDNEPSQRAILIRAIRETPALLEQAIAKCKSWHDVIAYIMARHIEWREALNEREREAARRRAEDEPTPRQALTAVGGVFERVAESLGYVRSERAATRETP